MNWHTPSNEMALGFDDVLLVPQYSEIKSRKNIYLTDPETMNDGLPVMSSPMDTVTGVGMAHEVMRLGGVPILPRSMSDSQILDALDYLEDQSWGGQPMGFAVSSLITEKTLDLTEMAAIHTRRIIVCLDIAHGHTLIAKEWLEEMKKHFPANDRVRLMVGSVCTYSAVIDLKNWGADIIRFGVGNGSICSTRLNTGHGYPQLSGLMAARRVLDVYGLIGKVLLVADGGIRNAGDAAKALAAGADYVMLGSMLAGTDEAPGDVVEVDGRKYKSYHGMASRTAQEARQRKAWSVEGVESLVPCKGPVGPLLDEFAANLKSAYSYSGANGLKDFQAKAEFVRVSPTTIHSETGTHIFNVASRT